MFRHKMVSDLHKTEKKKLISRQQELSNMKDPSMLPVVPEDSEYSKYFNMQR